MGFKKLPKLIPKPLQPPSPLTSPNPNPNLTAPPQTSPIPLPALSLSLTSQAQLSQFLKAHLTFPFTPQHLFTFLKKNLHHHPKFTHFDLYIFTWASTIDSFRHDHSTYEWMVRTLSITDRFDDLRSVLEGEVP